MAELHRAAALNNAKSGLRRSPLFFMAASPQENNIFEEE